MFGQSIWIMLQEKRLRQRLRQEFDQRASEALFKNRCVLCLAPKSNPVEICPRCEADHRGGAA